jgi:hypothetical protein
LAIIIDVSAATILIILVIIGAAVLNRVFSVEDNISLRHQEGVYIIYIMMTKV